MINTTCPKCNAPHAKKLKLIYEEGITSVNQQSTSLTKTDLIINPKIKTSSTISGESISKLAKSVAPPREPNLSNLSVRHAPILTFLIPLLVMVMSVIYGIFSEKFLYVILSPFVGAIVGAIPAVIIEDIISKTPEGKRKEEVAKEKIKERKVEHEKELVRWESTFMCMQCGEKFIPE